MDKATREIEKKYLKLDEPVLNNVLIRPFRSRRSSLASEPSIRKNLRIYPSISMKKRSTNCPNISEPTKSRATGLSAWPMLP